MTSEQSVCILKVACDNLGEMMAFLTNPDAEMIDTVDRKGKPVKGLLFEAQGVRYIAVEGDYLIRDKVGRFGVARIQGLD